MKHEPNFNAAWARVVIGTLVDAGVTRFVIAPGSRSSPLVRAAVQHEDAQCTLWLDERGAAFYAVGIARAQGIPAAVITTSGTAVANLLPACVEAFHDAVPLVLITADRPDALVQAGANQTIAQPNLFEGFVRSAADMQPDERIPAADVCAAIQLALHGAFGVGPNGPVHLNLRFDEPLAPTPDASFGDSWLDAGTTEPFAVSQPATPDIDPTMLARLREASSGLVVTTAHVGDAGLELARTLGWPLYPDVRSDLRLATSEPWVWTHAPAHLGEGAWSPDVLLLLGPHPTDGRFLQWAAAASFDQILVVDEHDHRRDGFRLPPSMVWTDVAEEDFEVGPWSKGPRSGALIRTVAPPRAWAAQAAQLLRDDPGEKPDLTQVCAWQAELEQAAEEGLDAEAVPDLTGAVIARHISQAIRPDGAIVLSNSMPVRDFGRFAVSSGPAVPVHTNRGASGIDGILSLAAGVAGAHGPTTLLIGDQAFLHDLSALAGIARTRPPLTVVLQNNGGGQIFRMLPIAKHEDIFTPWFDATHDHLLGPLCEVFGIAHTTVDTRAEYVEAYAASQQGEGPSVIEAITSPLTDRLTADRSE